MGSFDELFMAADIIKGGIAAAKASGKLEELADASFSDYEDVLTDENKAL